MKRLLALLAALVAPPAIAETPPARFTVVSVYEGMADYAEAVAADPAADRQALWARTVIDPYWERCADGAQYLDYGPPLREAMGDVEGLRARAAALRASSVETLVRVAAEKAASLLPGPPTTVCVLAADSSWTYLRDMHGVGGFTPGAGKVWLTILPEGDWKDWIAYGVAHEYHHSAWMAGPREIGDLADYLAFEGRADAFALLVDPARRAPWTSALTEAEQREAWNAMLPRLGSTDAQVLQGLMFGGFADVPRWAGYTVGFNRVRAYLEAHPGMTVGEWTALPARELVGPSASELE